MTSQNQNFGASVEPPANEQLHDLKTIAQRLDISIRSVHLETLIRAIQARHDISLQRRREMASAITVMGRAIGLPPSEIPADPVFLRPRIAQITATGAGLSEARWRNVKSLFNAAMTIAGASTMGRRSTAALLPAWRDVLRASRIDMIVPNSANLRDFAVCAV